MTGEIGSTLLICGHRVDISKSLKLCQAKNCNAGGVTLMEHFCDNGENKKSMGPGLRFSP